MAAVTGEAPPNEEASAPPLPPPPLPAATNEISPEATEHSPIAVPTTTPASEEAQMFALTLGMDLKELSIHVDVEALLGCCGGSVESALDLFFSDESLAKELAPPTRSAASPGLTASSQGSNYGAVAALPVPPAPAQDAEVMLACGHVEAALPALPSFEAVLQLCGGISRGDIGPTAVVEEGVGEFSNGIFTIVVPLDVAWN